MSDYPGYPAELRDVAQRCVSAALTARQRNLDGLADRLADAAESARSWADAIEDEETSR